MTFTSFQTSVVQRKQQGIHPNCHKKWQHTCQTWTLSDLPIQHNTTSAPIIVPWWLIHAVVILNLLISCINFTMLHFITTFVAYWLKICKIIESIWRGSYIKGHKFFKDPIYRETEVVELKFISLWVYLNLSWLLKDIRNGECWMTSWLNKQTTKRFT
jgi:hypothetical protein